MLIYARIVGILLGIAANMTILREWFIRTDLELRDMVGDIILRESLLVGAAAFATGIIIVSAWPVLVWCCGIPSRKRAARVARVAEAAAREREEILALLETVRDQDDTMRYAFSGGKSQAHAMALMAQQKLNEKGFRPPRETRELRRGEPGDWKEFAPFVIAHIEGYGIKATREAIARAQAEAEEELSEGAPPA